MYLTDKQLAIFNFIKEYRAEHSYSPTLDEIAKEFGVTKVTIYEHVRALEKKGIITRSKYQTRSIEIPAESSLAIPFSGYIHAGLPLEAIEQEGESIALDSLFRSDRPRFALRVKGNSMIEEQIREGDIVIVEKRDEARNGESVIALLENGEATLKKFYQETTRIRLQPANDQLDPIFVDTIDIQGVVIGVIRAY
ncbi:MAG: transcriptional repressor LexA [Planctomycetota bacterium]|nr:transcriptional repressor LexA [Planctomycetota bacterium]